MPRTARKLLGNICIHNMIQGINKEYIFQKCNYKEKYLELINKYNRKHNILIISYCIMDNHVHLLTYSESIKDLSNFMRDINTHYAHYYNKINNRVGYVFRNRFQSKPILSEEQLYKCINYIHMNPVKAGIVNNIKDYEFSSYNKYLNQENFKKTQIYKKVLKSNKNYLNQLKSIKYENFNIDNKQVNLEEVFKEFISNNNYKSQIYNKDTIIIKKFIAYLISNEYKFSKTDIAKLFNISRSQLYRKLSENI